MNFALLYFFNTDLVQASMAALETTWLSHHFDRMNVLSKAIKVSPVFAQRWMTLWWLWWKAICWPGMSRHPGCVTVIRMAVCCTFLSQAVWSQMVLYITFSKHPVLSLGRWLQCFHNMWIIVLHYLHVRVQTSYDALVRTPRGNKWHLQLESWLAAGIHTLPGGGGYFLKVFSM